MGNCEKVMRNRNCAAQENQKCVYKSKYERLCSGAEILQELQPSKKHMIGSGAEIRQN